jgi:hypothetical protein
VTSFEEFHNLKVNSQNVDLILDQRQQEQAKRITKNGKQADREVMLTREKER